MKQLIGAIIHTLSFLVSKNIIDVCDRGLGDMPIRIKYKSRGRLWIFCRHYKALRRKHYYILKAVWVAYRRKENNPLLPLIVDMVPFWLIPASLAHLARLGGVKGEK